MIQRKDGSVVRFEVDREAEIFELICSASTDLVRNTVIVGDKEYRLDERYMRYNYSQQMLEQSDDPTNPSRWTQCPVIR